MANRDGRVLANLSFCLHRGLSIDLPAVSESTNDSPLSFEWRKKKKSTCRVSHPSDFYGMTDCFFFYLATFALKNFDLFQDIFYFEKRKWQKKNTKDFYESEGKISSSRHSHTHFDIHLYIYIYIYRNVEILLTLCSLTSNIYFSHQLPFRYNLNIHDLVMSFV